MIVYLYKMHINEIIIKNIVSYFDNLIKLIKTKILETKSILTHEESIRIW